jgi:hypothetical protein
VAIEDGYALPANPVQAPDYVMARDATLKTERMNMDDPIKIDNRGDFGLWAIEAAKQIVSDEGFELAKAARDGSDEELRLAGNALGQAITTALMEVYDGLLEDAD